MKRFAQYVLRLRVWKDESGQDLVEYSLAAGLIAAAAVAAMPALTGSLSTVFSKIGSMLDAGL